MPSSASIIEGLGHVVRRPESCAQSFGRKGLTHLWGKGLTHLWGEGLTHLWGKGLTHLWGKHLVMGWQLCRFHVKISRFDSPLEEASRLNRESQSRLSHCCCASSTLSSRLAALRPALRRNRMSTCKRKSSQVKSSLLISYAKFFQQLCR